MTAERTLQTLTERSDDPRAICCASCVERPNCAAFAAYAKRYLDLTTGTDADAAFLGIQLAQGVKCDDYRSLFINYPITVNGITVDRTNSKQLDVGRPALIKLGMVNGFDDNLHLAIYLGQLPISIVSAYTPATCMLANRLMLNPCLLVPLYGRLFYGMNAGWSFATTESLPTVYADDKTLPEYTWAVDWLMTYGDNNGKPGMRTGVRHGSD